MGQAAVIVVLFGAIIVRDRHFLHRPNVALQSRKICGAYRLIADPIDTGRVRRNHKIWQKSLPFAVIDPLSICRIVLLPARPKLSLGCTVRARVTGQDR